MRKILVALILFFLSPVLAQQNFTFKITEQETGAAIPEAKITIDSLGLGAISGIDGIARLAGIPNGRHKISIRSVGFEDFEFFITFPTKQPEPRVVSMVPDGLLDEIIVESTRSNKSISDSPARIEVLTDEIDEAASMEPGKVSHLLTHTTGIQVQTTSATSNGSVIRIQGMNGRYTQLLRDGFPMYGGFSGSLDVMQIAPLDLRQVEFIKGPASTLYGGGAIGGIVNLLSKTPGTDETLLHLNASNIGARDFNAFVSRKFGNFGFTNLASLHLHNAYDPDHDGFSDLAQVTKFNFNPKLFYTVGGFEIYLGATIQQENRLGGDMALINNAPLSLTDFYVDEQESFRAATQFRVTLPLSQNARIIFRNSFSSYERSMLVRENYTTSSQFAGQQLNSYTEWNFFYDTEKHTFNAGVNLVSDRFLETDLGQVDTLRNQEYQTFGAYLNEIWDLSKIISMEAGLRADYVSASSFPGGIEQAFILPRFSALFRVVKGLTLRLGGGMGYRMPTIFNEESEPFAYRNIQPVDFTTTRAEQSTGGNFDIKYTTTFGTDNLLLTFNQLFFYNLIDNPVFLIPQSFGGLAYQNYGNRVHSRGFETQVKFTFWKITWFLGYTYNQAFLEHTYNYWLTLAPQHSIKGDFLFVAENKWRIGLDYEYKSAQWLSAGIQSPSIFMTGLVIERTIGNFVLFANAGNVTDVRQSKHESLVSGPNNTPQLTEVWGPLDGRFFNGGIKIKL
jgi:outer membrane receptor for ferrienterochelin and colicins